ncbi:pyruvate dehydrogenase [Trichoderma chlorosporum]
MALLRAAQTRFFSIAAASTRISAKRWHSTKGSSSASPVIKSIRYAAIAGVVGVPGFWWLTAATYDEVPHLESSPALLDREPGPSKQEVTRIISQGAYSFPVRNVAAVTRYDGAQLASNSPCEDRFIHGKFASPWNNDHWMAWAIFDGHAGWQTADLISKRLLSFVRHSLSRVDFAPKQENIPQEAVQRAIIKGFLDLDDSIIKAALDVPQGKEPLQDKVKKLVAAYSGSCALLSMYDPAANTLHVACTGDSRAVLGQKGLDGKWEAIPLSSDQTGSNKEEIARVSKEHPGEENIVKDGRVLGMMVSRAFGDGRWKWPLEFQQDIRRSFYGPSPLTPKYDVRTPPYLTAEPVVTSTKIPPNKPCFMILASDGMWDMLSNQQAVDLVGKWLEFQGEKYSSKLEPTREPFDFGQFWKGVDWKFVEGRTIVQDDNVAVHLVRNSLGGNHHELIAGRLAFTSPFSRGLRDDVTVQVVFFNIAGLKK